LLLYRLPYPEKDKRVIKKNIPFEKGMFQNVDKVSNFDTLSFFIGKIEKRS